jgi:hypothetical protein
MGSVRSGRGIVFREWSVLGQSMSLTHCFVDSPRKVVAHPSGVAAFVFPEQLGQHVTDCDYEATLVAVERMAGVSLLLDRLATRSDWLLAELGCS